MNTTNLHWVITLVLKYSRPFVLFVLFVLFRNVMLMSVSPILTLPVWTSTPMNAGNAAQYASMPKHADID